MEKKIYKYLVDEIKCNKTVAQLLYDNINKQPSVMNEFRYWVENRAFVNDNPLTIDGYTAEYFYHKHALKGVGAFSLMADLLNDHEATLKYIQAGCPR